MLNKPELSALARMIRKDRQEVVDAVAFLSVMFARGRRRRRVSKSRPKARRRRAGGQTVPSATSASVKS